MNGSEQCDIQPQIGVPRSTREAINHHKGAILWLTGSIVPHVAGVARTLDVTLTNWGAHSYVLDARLVLSRLDRNWGKDTSTPREDARRVAEMAGLFADAGIITLVVAPNLGEDTYVQARAAFAPNEVLLVAITPSNRNRMSVQLRRLSDAEGAGAPHPPHGFPVASDRKGLGDDSREAHFDSGPCGVGRQRFDSSIGIAAFGGPQWPVVLRSPMHADVSNRSGPSLARNRRAQAGPGCTAHL